MVAEFERRYSLNNHPGTVRLLAFLNRAHMGSYQAAIDSPIRPADIEATRDYRYKYGFGLNLEQELARDIGVFSRLGWSDGNNEAWVFSDVDRTATLGVSVKGESWHRPNDTVGLAGDPYAGMRAELFQISGDRDCHIIVTALPQRRTLLFANPNYAIDLAFYANFLVQGICARKKIVHNVGPNDGHIGTVGLIIIVKHAARSQVHIENGSHGRRQSSYPGVADGLLSIFDVTAWIEGRRPEHHAMPAFLEDGLIVVHSQILALLAFEKLVDVGDDGTDFTDDENVSAQIKDLLCHVSIDAVDKGNHSDDGGYSNYHSEQGQD